jgi:hypothetical protein
MKRLRSRITQIKNGQAAMTKKNMIRIILPKTFSIGSAM